MEVPTANTVTSALVLPVLTRFLPVGQSASCGGVPPQTCFDDHGAFLMGLSAGSRGTPHAIMEPGPMGRKRAEVCRN
jgi:hypothetical protein